VDLTGPCIFCSSRLYISFCCWQLWQRRCCYFCFAIHIFSLDSCSEKRFCVLGCLCSTFLLLHGKFPLCLLLYFGVTKLATFKAGIVSNNVFCLQVSAWGGYVFIINLVPLHVFVLLLMQRFSRRVYVGKYDFGWDSSGSIDFSWMNNAMLRSIWFNSSSDWVEVAIRQTSAWCDKNV